MTEPREVAGSVAEVVPGVWHWRIHNSAIGGSISSSHAVEDGGGGVLIDPVRLADEALATLPSPSAVVLNARCHQRAAWTYRTQFGIEVWLPADAAGADEEPDRRFAEGDALPGGLVAVRTPGPEWAHYSLLLERGPGVLFVPDLIGAGGDGELRFLPPQHRERPIPTRRRVERLLDLPFSVLCLDHGAPLVSDPKAALRALLARTS
jgi:hypothetical protein